MSLKESIMTKKTKKSVSTFEAIAEDQGWNDESKLSILLDFIAENKLDDKLVEFAEDRAEEENGGMDDEDDEDEDDEDEDDEDEDEEEET